MEDSYDIFISYRYDKGNGCCKGKDMAKLLYDLFTHDGYSVFYDDKTPGHGEPKLADYLEAGVRRCGSFVLIVSEGCFNSGREDGREDNYLNEISWAVKYKKRIFPVVIPGGNYRELPDREDFNCIKNLRYERYDGNIGNLFSGFYKKIVENITSSLQLEVTSNLCCTMYKKVDRIESNKAKGITLSKGEHDLMFVSDENNEVNKKIIIKLDKRDKSLLVDLKSLMQDYEAEKRQEWWPFEVGASGFVMKYVKGGSFDVGLEQVERKSTEKGKTIKVVVDSFWMSETVVTQSLYKAVMGGMPKDIEKIIESEGGLSKTVYKEGDNYPVVYVSWDEAQMFVDKLSEKTGRMFRLPTCREWEYAARGGVKDDGNQVYSGGAEIGDVAWYKGNCKDHMHIMPVKPDGGDEKISKKPNLLGLYNMSGNVFEWCQDKSRIGDDWRVTKGGSCSHDEECCRVSYSSSAERTRKGDTLGFRIVMDL